MQCLELERPVSWVELGLNVGMKTSINFPWDQEFSDSSKCGIEPPASELQFQPLKVTSRLFSAHSTEDKIPRLMVKQLFPSKNTQRDSQSCIEKIRGKKEKGEMEEKRESQRGSKRSSQ